MTPYGYGLRLDVIMDTLGLFGTRNLEFNYDGCDGAGLETDRCLICGGMDECVGCDDMPFSNKFYDACGVCGGRDETCTGCDAVLFSGVR